MSKEMGNEPRHDKGFRRGSEPLECTWGGPTRGGYSDVDFLTEEDRYPVTGDVLGEAWESEDQPCTKRCNRVQTDALRLYMGTPPVLPTQTSPPIHLQKDPSRRYEPPGQDASHHPDVDLSTPGPYHFATHGQHVPHRLCDTQWAQTRALRRR